jgi:hypothetical protein
MALLLSEYLGKSLKNQHRFRHIRFPFRPARADEDQGEAGGVFCGAGADEMTW